MKKFSPKFNNLLDFIEFTHEFREVVRMAKSPLSDRLENDSEHSYQLAVVAWYIIETDKLKLNKELCFMYALAHDLVEVYAGDTYIFDGDPKRLLSKERRERQALHKIEKRFSKFKTLTKVIERYEKKADEESKFIYALDKILPPIQIYMDKGKLWHERGVSYEKLVGNKHNKIKVSKPVNKYWNELLIELTKNRKKLFPK